MAKKEKEKNNMFVVLCKQRKKLDKYFKINRIRNKIIIDVKKMAEDEGLTYEDAVKYEFFKLLILKEFYRAIDRKRDIYYIPHFETDDMKENPTKILTMKEMDIIDTNFTFNLLCFYNDFDAPAEVTEILNKIEEFDFIQLLKDY